MSDFSECVIVIVIVIVNAMRLPAQIAFHDRGCCSIAGSRAGGFALEHLLSFKTKILLPTHQGQKQRRLFVPSLFCVPLRTHPQKVSPQRQLSTVSANSVVGDNWVSSGWKQRGVWHGFFMIAKRH